MAIAFVAARGSAQSKASSASIAVSVGASVPVGALMLVRCASDNIGTTSAANTSEHSVSDSKGNVWTKIREHRRSSGAAADGVTASLWMAKLTVALVAADTITLTLPSAVPARCIAAQQYSIGGKPEVAQVVSVAGASATPSLTLSGEEADYLLYGLAGLEGPNGDAYTQDTDYVQNVSVGTTGGGAATNIAMRNGHRLAHGSSDTYNPSAGVARDGVLIFAAIVEVVTRILGGGELASGKALDDASLAEMSADFGFPIHELTLAQIGDFLTNPDKRAIAYLRGGTLRGLMLVVRTIEPVNGWQIWRIVTEKSLTDAQRLSGFRDMARDVAARLPGITVWGIVKAGGKLDTHMLPLPFTREIAQFHIDPLPPGPDPDNPGPSTTVVPETVRYSATAAVVAANI